MRRNHLAVVVALALAIIASIGLSLDVDRRMKQLRTAAPDNIHWVTSRAEIEVLQLRLSLRDAHEAPDLPLDDVRRRFDTFYSHVQTLAAGDVYAGLRTAIDFDTQSQALHGFTTMFAPVIDGPDGRLRSALPEIEAAATQLMPLIRDISQQAMQWYSGEVDKTRRSMTTTLSRIGLMAVTLVMSLSVLAFILLRLSRQAQARARMHRKTANRLQTILETSLDAVLVFDASSRILAYNPAAATIFGYSQEQALGRLIADILVPDTAQNRFFRALTDFNATGRSHMVGAGRLNGLARNKAGKTFPVEFSVDRIEDDFGPIFVTFLRDITDRRQAEAALVEARDKALAGQRAKAEFLAVMSHEMRTPLNGLLGTMALLRDTTLTSRQRQYLENMDASGRLLMHHVNDVLEISKFEAGKVVIAHMPFDLEQMLEELVEGQRDAAAARSNTLDCRWLSDPVTDMLGDPVRMRQVLLNLIGNAIKFTRNGDITIEVEAVSTPEGEAVAFHVADTGIGIEDSHLERIFGDFETVDSTYRRGEGGTGLGLGIARRLTEAMGGQISVQSVKDAGSVFSVRLPLARAAQDLADAPVVQPPAAQRPLNVLIVEDNQINRVVLRDMLVSDGHCVTEAMNGAEGVKLAEMMLFDIILTDISMPVMDGIEATRAIRAGGGRSADVPILAVTAHALPEEIGAFLAAGMNDVIGKPIQRSVLQRKLADYSRAAQPDVTQPAGAAPAVPVSPVSPPDTPVDEVRIGELLNDLGADVAAQLLQRFIAETDETFGTISADASQSMHEMVPRLHRIAGSAAVLGAARLHKRLGELEVLGKQGKEDRFRDGLSDLAPIWLATRARMQALVAQG